MRMPILSSGSRKRKKSGMSWAEELEAVQTKSGGTPALEQVCLLGVGGQGTVSLCKVAHTGELIALKASHTTTIKARSSRDRAHGAAGSSAAAAAAARAEAEAEAKEEDSDKEEEEECQSGIRKEYNMMKFLIESWVRGIVAVRGICVNDATDELCLMLEFCNGGSLQAELESRASGRLSEREAARLLSSLAETLEQCHALGIMHRDVKPDNVLIQRTDNPATTMTTKEICDGIDIRPLDGGCRFLLADFGLATRLRRGHRIRDGRLIGTCGYLAPEMVVDRAYDERADVWSLGILLHAALTGYIPLELRQHGKEHRHRQLSREARSLLRRMLRHDPRRRITLSAIRTHPWVLGHTSSAETAAAATSAKTAPTTTTHAKGRRLAKRRKISITTSPADHPRRVGSRNPFPRASPAPPMPALIDVEEEDVEEVEIVEIVEEEEEEVGDVQLPATTKCTQKIKLPFMDSTVGDHQRPAAAAAAGPANDTFRQQQPEDEQQPRVRVRWSGKRTVIFIPYQLLGQAA